MPEINELYKAFISSPSDVKRERDIASQTIAKMNKILINTLKLSLYDIKWEDMPISQLKLSETKIQEELNIEVESSHFFILIMHTSYGKTAKGYRKSNTEREINTILKCFKRNPQKKILPFFKEIADKSGHDPEADKIEKLRSKLHKLEIPTKSFKTPSEFRELLTHELYDAVIRMRVSTFKSRAVNNFWKLGSIKENSRPKLAILYPTVPRVYMGGTQDDTIWRTRLEPNVYYEDFRAINRLIRMYDLIGFGGYRIHKHCDIIQNLMNINRLWLCYPRLDAAQERLKAYNDKTRFSFRPRTDNSKGWLNWKDKDGGKITIRSPLETYLKIQRKSDKSKVEWEPILGNIMCKNFAIIARFNDTRHAIENQDMYLRDFFLAGIRGLGTWGTTWYLDRKYAELKNYSSADDIQILLEVIYANGNIYDVKNVSNESQEYFHNENLIGTVKKNIKLFDNTKQIR